MTAGEWRMLADKLEKQRLTNRHTPQTADMLAALRDVAMKMWADAHLPKNYE